MVQLECTVENLARDVCADVARPAVGGVEGHHAQGMSILTGQNHTVVAEYDTPQACEMAAQAHRKALSENNITLVYSCSPKAGSR